MFVQKHLSYIRKEARLFVTLDRGFRCSLELRVYSIQFVFINTEVLHVADFLKAVHKQSSTERQKCKAKEGLSSRHFILI